MPLSTEQISLRTHTGEIITGKRLQDGLNKVADDMIQNAKDIRSSNEYASHVTEEEKDNSMNRSIENAEKVRRGEKMNNFSIWQDLNMYFTGECIALLT